MTGYTITTPPGTLAQVEYKDGEMRITCVSVEPQRMRMTAPDMFEFKLRHSHKATMGELLLWLERRLRLRLGCENPRGEMAQGGGDE